MKYLTIDFETANRYEYSPCSVAIYQFENNVSSKVYSTLINPGNIEFDEFLISIHGITKDMVENAPSIEQVLKQICIIIKDNFVFAHNAGFDISKIIMGCVIYNLSIPNFEYADSLMIAKRTWPGLINYRLDTVAEYLQLPFNHHNAEDDAKICGEIINASLQQHNCSSIDELLDAVKYVKGIYFENEWKHAYSKSLYNRNKNKKTDYEKASNFNINTDITTSISGKYFVFTGSLNIPRSKAMELCADKGAIPQGGINKLTNYLVVGRNDYGNFKDGNKSNKIIKAESLIKNGQDLEIITEADFFKMI